jgi:hypothetical protein
MLIGIVQFVVSVRQFVFVDSMKDIYAWLDFVACFAFQTGPSSK